MRKIRILYVIGPMLAGGAERHLVDLVRGMRRLVRFEPHAAVLGRAGPLFPELSSRAVSATVVPKRGKADPACPLRLARLIRDLSPDIVHTFMWTGNLWGRLAALIAHRGPLLSSERCPDDWKRPWHWAIDRLLYRRTDRLVAVAQAVADVYERRAAIPRERIRVIRSGKEFPESSPERAAARDRLGLAQDAVVASLVGRFSPEKGHRLLLDCARATLERVPGLLLYLPGEGPLLEGVRAEAYRLGLERRVLFPGFRADMDDVYAATDLLLVPSDYEGISNVLLEGMARGVPAVATSVGGTPEVVEHGVTGLLVPPANPGRLASAIVQLALNGTLRRRMGDACRIALRDRFHQSRVIREYADLYGEALAERGLIVQ